MATDDPVTRYRYALLASGLGRFADALVEAVRPSIRLEPEIALDDALPPGASKLGGRPDLTAGSSWPAAHGIPLAFVAQLRLDELSALDGERVLPSAGLLSFFLEATWALTGNSRDPSWHVLFTPASTSLERMELPVALDPYARYEPRRCTGDASTRSCRGSRSSWRSSGLAERT